MDPFGKVIEAKGLRVSPVVLSFHSGRGEQTYSGLSQIECGTSLIVKLLLKLGKFPPAGKSIPTLVTTFETKNGARWHRNFGGHITISEISNTKDVEHVVEYFGPIRMELSLRAENECLLFDISKISLFGIPAPKFCFPTSETREFAAENGEMNFDVSASLPIFGLLIRYQGALSKNHT